jgi:deazaflavin-dependent oxidoreductase (nitroreductase family)
LKLHAPILDASDWRAVSNESSVPSSDGKPPPRWVLKSVTRVHVFLHRLTGGLNRLGGDEVCFVEMIGARTGRTLTFPLMYVPYQEGVLLVASQGGAPKNPVWYHNLVKNPNIEVEHRGKRLNLRARLADPTEKETLWPICDQHYAPYAEYRMRTTRDIPVFVCEQR